MGVCEWLYMHSQHFMYKASGAEQPVKRLKRSTGALVGVGAAAPALGHSLTNSPANQTPANKAASLGDTHWEAATALC